MSNDNVELTGSDALTFEPVSDEVSTAVDSVQMQTSASAKKRTANAYTDIAVVALERVAKGSIVVRNHAAAEVATGEPTNLVQTKVLGSIDSGKTFEHTVLAEETGVSPANSTGIGVNRLQEAVPHGVAGVPSVLTHLKVQAKAHAAGAQGTVSVRGAFEMKH